MRIVLIYFLVLLLNSCSDGYEEQENLLPSGETRIIKTKVVHNSDLLLIKNYKSGETFLKLKKFDLEASKAEEAFWYYKDGSIMDYKFYLDERLKFYSRYDENGNVVQLNGDPILYYEDDTTIHYVEPNIGLVNETLTFTPPKMALKIWYYGNEHEDPYNQITSKGNTLEMELIKNDTIGYIFSVDDNFEKRIPILWSLEDSTSGNILKTGRIIHRFKARSIE